MPRRKLDKIADATFSFRLNSSDKEKLVTKLNSLRSKLNKTDDGKKYLVTKNEIIYAALIKGLKTLAEEDIPKRNNKK